MLVAPALFHESGSKMLIAPRFAVERSQIGRIEQFEAGLFNDGPDRPQQYPGTAASGNWGTWPRRLRCWIRQRRDSNVEGARRVIACIEWRFRRLDNRRAVP